MIWGSEGKGLFVITSVWFFHGTLNLRRTWPDKQATVYLLLPSPHLTFNLVKNVNRPQMYKCSHALSTAGESSVSSASLLPFISPEPWQAPCLQVEVPHYMPAPRWAPGSAFALLTFCGPLSELQPLLGCNQLYRQTIPESSPTTNQ